MLHPSTLRVLARREDCAVSGPNAQDPPCTTSQWMDKTPHAQPPNGWCPPAASRALLCLWLKALGFGHDAARPNGASAQVGREGGFPVIFRHSAGEFAAELPVGSESARL